MQKVNPVGMEAIIELLWTDEEDFETIAPMQDIVLDPACARPLPPQPIAVASANAYC